MRDVDSWGRLGPWPHQVAPLTDRAQAAQWVHQSHRAHGAGIAYGNGRSYGDVGLNAHGLLWTTRHLDKWIAFDPDQGLLTCEAGVLLRDLQRWALPRGWMLPVTPGTQLITVGGAIANDVHGKNHHVMGTFGDHVRALQLVRTDGQVIACSPTHHTEWLAATIGGMGLTGVITEAQLQLRRVAGPWMDTYGVPFTDLNGFFEVYRRAEQSYEHTVAWIDCAHRPGTRGILLAANHAADTDAAPAARKDRVLPFTPPVSLVNRLSLPLFNQAYFRLHQAKSWWTQGRSKAHYESFFYPLDGLHHWNRMYGPKGFYQYQSLVPWRDGIAATHAMLKTIQSSGRGSFLAVLKTFGERPAQGMLSFVQPGITLALDFPANDPGLKPLMQRLDAIVLEAGGRLYPAKDARMSRSMFEAGYPSHAAFQRLRDPGISSSMSRRLMGW